MINRRDFIKKMAVGGAVASVFGHLGTGARLLGPRDAVAAESKRVVFLSDVHLSADAEHAAMSAHLVDLAAFLDNLNTRKNVAEVVLLGDIFEGWAIPAESVPTSFLDILDAPQNASVVSALQGLCANPEIGVTYVTGNHDLLSFEAVNRQAIAETFPGMTIVSEAPGLGAYAKDEVIWAEHGHRYTLFNAPDVWSHEGSHLPLGYFITRLASSKSAVDGRVYPTPDLLNRLLKDTAGALNRTRGNREPYVTGPNAEGVIDDVLIVAIFNAIALWAGKRPRDVFVMDGLDGFAEDPFVESVALLYDRIYSEWPARQNIVNKRVAFFSDLGEMDAAADLLLFMPEQILQFYPFAPRIVLFGHTHKPCLAFHGWGGGTIYANTGTWTDDHPMTWVEIEIAEPAVDLRAYRVELWFYNEIAPKQVASIIVGGT